MAVNEKARKKVRPIERLVRLAATVRESVTRFLHQGMTPEDLALACSLGFVLGIFPVPGASTALCAVVAALLRLNMAVIQAVNYAVWPAQLVMVIPFIKLGSLLLGHNDIALSEDQVVMAYEKGWLAVFEQLGLWIAIGIGAWIVSSIPLAVTTRYAMLWLILWVRKPK